MIPKHQSVVTMPDNRTRLNILKISTISSVVLFFKYSFITLTMPHAFFINVSTSFCVNDLFMCSLIDCIIFLGSKGMSLAAVLLLGFSLSFSKWLTNVSSDIFQHLSLLLLALLSMSQYYAGLLTLGFASFDANVFVLIKHLYPLAISLSTALASPLLTFFSLP